MFSEPEDTDDDGADIVDGHDDGQRPVIPEPLEPGVSHLGALPGHVLMRTRTARNGGRLVKARPDPTDPKTA